MNLDLECCQTPWTNPDFGMLVGKGCQTKNTTGFLKLRYCQTNYELDFGRKISILPDESYELDFGRKISILPDESYKLNFGRKISILPDESYELDFGHIDIARRIIRTGLWTKDIGLGFLYVNCTLISAGFGYLWILDW
ncbi:hypothetical protein RclHR1_08560007 [Rhizophagus clarus]|uniref:Uncharacterized protein n=1 Tax=Rhizophagus clarus TaxID=94130 RepID=A0A2Z6S3J4_9GLOM|nr:hypothetical protein RclHR1_08560007 [Rhizophagus clarus]